MSVLGSQVHDNYDLKTKGFILTKDQQKKIHQIMEHLYEVCPYASKLSLELEKRGENYIGKIDLKSTPLKTFIKKVGFDPILTTLFIKEELETEIIGWRRKRRITKAV